MTKLLFTFFLGTLIGLTACQPGGGGTSPAGAGTQSVPPLGGPAGGGGSLPDPTARGGSGVGGVDPVGGGNGVNGVSLDNYKIDLMKLPAYQRVNEKVLIKLAKVFPKLAGDLMFVANSKTWYLIKTQLDTLPSAKIGVSFKTEQFALQNKSEIWVNDIIYSTMKDHDQDGLILHELVMGVRLLEFANDLDRCLAGIELLKLDESTAESYPEKRRECFKKNKLASDIGDISRFGKQIQLADEDYFSIRSLTSHLLDGVDDINAEELEDWMAIRNFRKY